MPCKSLTAACLDRVVAHKGAACLRCWASAGGEGCLAHGWGGRGPHLCGQVWAVCVVFCVHVYCLCVCMCVCTFVVRYGLCVCCVLCACVLFVSVHVCMHLCGQVWAVCVVLCARVLFVRVHVCMHLCGQVWGAYVHLLPIITWVACSCIRKIVGTYVKNPGIACTHVFSLVNARSRAPSRMRSCTVTLIATHLPMHAHVCEHSHPCTCVQTQSSLHVCACSHPCTCVRAQSSLHMCAHSVIPALVCTQSHPWTCVHAQSSLHLCARKVIPEHVCTHSHPAILALWGLHGGQGSLAPHAPLWPAGGRATPRRMTALSTCRASSTVQVGRPAHFSGPECGPAAWLHCSGPIRMVSCTGLAECARRALAAWPQPSPGQLRQWVSERRLRPWAMHRPVWPGQLRPWTATCAGKPRSHGIPALQPMSMVVSTMACVKAHGRKGPFGNHSLCWPAQVRGPMKCSHAPSAGVCSSPWLVRTFPTILHAQLLAHMVMHVRLPPGSHGHARPTPGSHGHARPTTSWLTWSCTSDSWLTWSCTSNSWLTWSCTSDSGLTWSCTSETPGSRGRARPTPGSREGKAAGSMATNGRLRARARAPCLCAGLLTAYHNKHLQVSQEHTKAYTHAHPCARRACVQTCSPLTTMSTRRSQTASCRPRPQSRGSLADPGSTPLQLTAPTRLLQVGAGTGIGLTVRGKVSVAGSAPMQPTAPPRLLQVGAGTRVRWPEHAGYVE